ncbi:hypothetical protein AYI69_g9862 [Smittium culicis]|uniref:Uncharacterized protein n=1 Tax=Smittium culicis TaxID=133412 RepID=A0A1R1X9Q6_9FUNG|nr:hypothetical protein AYI69_g9862 [Smittium culicis]
MSVPFKMLHHYYANNGICYKILVYCINLDWDSDYLNYINTNSNTRPSQEAIRSVHSFSDLVLVVLDRPRYVPLAIHNIAQVGVLVGGVDFLALKGHICGQLPDNSHYPALGGIHSHFPSVRPFGYGFQCGL